MVEKVLHGVNVGGCCLQLVTGAVEVASTGGVVTAAGAALSGLALWKKPQQAMMAQQMVAALEAHLDGAGLHPNIEKQVVLMFDGYLPGMAEIADGNCDANTIATAMRTRVADTTKVAEWQDRQTLDTYRDALAAMLGPLLVPQRQADANIVKLLERTEASAAYTRMLEAGISETTVIKLARQSDLKTNTAEQAWTELQRLVEIALKVQAEGRNGSNSGDFTDEVLHRAAALAADGDYAIAGAEIDAALEETDTQKVRLLQSGFDLALLAGDTVRAAALLVRKTEVEAGGVVDLVPLRNLQTQILKSGHDKGLLSESWLAIELAKITTVRATSLHDQGATLNELGLAYQAVGKNEPTSKNLELAVKAFHEALSYYTRDRVPSHWALTQHNLGNTLGILGSREGSYERLQEGLLAIRLALEECPSHLFPRAWAGMKSDEGNILQNLGLLEKNHSRSKEAIKAYQSALDVCDYESDERFIAGIHDNLGLALQNVGIKTKNFRCLQDAIAAHLDALDLRSREHFPFEWAGTQNNIGLAYVNFWEAQLEEAHLEAAQIAFENALQVWSPENASVHWAGVHQNLATLEMHRFDITGDANYLDRSERFTIAAREVFLAGAALHQLLQIEKLEEMISLRRLAA